MEDFKFQRKELFDAVEQSNVRQVRRLLSLKVSPYCLNAYGQTPLDVAIPIGHPEVMRLLQFAIATTPRPQPLFIGSDFAVSPQSAISNLLEDCITPVSGPAAALTQSLPPIYTLLSQPQTLLAPSVDYAQLVTKALQSSKPVAAPPPEQTADEVIDRVLKASVSASNVTLPAVIAHKATMPEVSASQAPALQGTTSKVTTPETTTPKATTHKATTRKSIVINMEPEAGFVAESDNAAIAPVATEMPVDTVPVDMETLLAEVTGKTAVSPAATEMLEKAEQPLRKKLIAPITPLPIAAKHSSKQTPSKQTPSKHTLSKHTLSKHTLSEQKLSEQKLSKWSRLEQSATQKDAPKSSSKNSSKNSFKNFPEQSPVPPPPPKRPTFVEASVNAPKVSPQPSLQLELQSTPKKPDYADLESAVKCNDTDAVQALLKAGVDLRPPIWYDTPVLVSAALFGHLETVQLLLSGGADVNTGYEQLPIHAAAKGGYVSILQCLLNSGARPNAQDDEGRTALMLAAAGGYLAAVELLVRSGASIRMVNRMGESATLLAEKSNHTAVHAFLYAQLNAHLSQSSAQAAVMQQYQHVQQSTPVPSLDSSMLDDGITAQNAPIVVDSSQLEELFTSSAKGERRLKIADMGSSDPLDKTYPKQRTA